MRFSLLGEMFPFPENKDSSPLKLIGIIVLPRNACDDTGFRTAREFPILVSENKSCIKY